jgi:hypothetical protein
VPSTGILSGLPGNDEVGQYNVKVGVDDGNGGHNYTNFQFTVVNTNDPPMIVGTDVTAVDEDARYVSDYDVKDIDKTDIAFTWGLKTNATWLSIGTSTGNLTGVPGNPDVGIYWVNVTVKDLANATDFRNFTLTVKNVNDAPVWVDVPTNVTIADTENYTFEVNAKDIDVGAILRYNITSAPASKISIDPVTGIIEWGSHDKGTYLIRIGVTDSMVEIYYNYQIVVVHVNVPPESALTSPVNGSTVSVLNPTLEWIVADKDGDAVTFDVYLGKDPKSVIGLDPATMLASGLNTTYFTPTTALDKGVTYYWTVVPHDGTSYGRCTSGVWSFSVSKTAGLNHLPRFVSTPSLEAGMGVEWTYSPQAVDEDAKDTVTYKLVSKPDGMTLVSGIMRWTPTSSQLGPHLVKVEATDGKGSVFQEFTVAVTKTGPTNHAPQISPVNPISVKAGQKVSVHITATDQENDLLTYSIVGTVPSGLQISPTGQLTWTTKTGDEGTYDIVIMVSDGKLSNTQSIKITVDKADKKVDYAYLVPMLLAIIAVIVGAIVAVIILLKRKGRGKTPTSTTAIQPMEALPIPPPTPPTISQEQSPK